MSGNHYRRSNHQMDDAELIKQEALRRKSANKCFQKHCSSCCVSYALLSLSSLCGLFLATNKDDIINPKTIR